VALAVSVVLPVAIAACVFHERWRRKEQQGRAASKKKPTEFDTTAAHGDNPANITEEPWCPKLELKEWQEAGAFSDCPWNFEGCEYISDVIRRIWQGELSSELQGAFDAIDNQVRNVNIARVTVSCPQDVVHFAAVYTLNSGAELFGGGPYEKAPRSSAEACRKPHADALPAGLAAFHRVHDGFGVLLSVRHLPFLMCSPDDTVQGSCFYVYPARGLEAPAARPDLVRFARVDSSCVACANRREGRPGVFYMDRGQEPVEEDEAPLAFVGDTVSNLAGQRVVPPAYLGGPGAFGVSACEGAL